MIIARFVQIWYGEASEGDNRVNSNTDFYFQE